MSLFKHAGWIWLVLILADRAASAEGFVLGAGVEGDSADGRAYSVFGDFGLRENTWLSLTASSVDTEGIIADNRSLLGELALDVWFDPVGLRVGVGYWGNSDILDSRDLKASAYMRNNFGSLALDYEWRDFEFDLQSAPLRGRTATFSANGWGISSRLRLGERVSVFVGGMKYAYSRNLRIQQDVDTLTYISRSRLSMINNLLDHRFDIGAQYDVGLRSFDVTAGQWQTAIDGSTVDSFSIGFLTPASNRVDIEFRLSYDDSEVYGNTTALSFYLYYFGGS
jgi:hypothetical protein